MPRLLPWLSCKQLDTADVVGAVVLASRGAVAKTLGLVHTVVVVVIGVMDEAAVVVFTVVGTHVVLPLVVVVIDAAVLPRPLPWWSCIRWWSTGRRGGRSSGRRVRSGGHARRVLTLVADEVDAGDVAEVVAVGAAMVEVTAVVVPAEVVVGSATWS